MRKGSITSSIVSRSSPIAAATLSRPDRAAVEAVDDGLEELPVHDVEAVQVDIEHGQGSVGERLGDRAVALDVGEVADAAQQPVGDPWRAARAARDLDAAVGVERHVQEPGRAVHDPGQLLGAVELEPATMPKRSRSGWSACRRGWSRR
jgi:hypothetical protein